jgi:CheY-like chemotaxis protein
MNSLSGDKKDPVAKAIAGFLSERRVLVVDPNAASRAGLAKAMIGFGAKSSQVDIVGTFSDARDRMREKKPEVLVCEYQLTGGNGLDLAQETASYTDPASRLFILVTSNSSQSLVAQAAEEDVDLYLLKPYTLKTFGDCIARIVQAKISPSAYFKAIEIGKKLLAHAKADEAIQVFKKAETLSAKPALALYYRGQAELIQKMVENAIGSFSLGLKHNEMHYKCITGLFDVLLDQKRHSDAYDVVKKIAKFFPSNPKRLSQVLSLAIQTHNFDDIDTYYQGFQEIEARNDELVRHVCAALVVCGKQFFRVGQIDKAVDMLNKAAITAAGKPTVLREIVTTLAEYGKLSEAQTVLARFPADMRNDVHYHMASFLLFRAENPAPEAGFMILGKIIRGGVRDPQLTYWLIRLLVQMGKVEQAENYKIDAEKEWPASKALFEKAYKGE